MTTVDWAVDDFKRAVLKIMTQTNLLVWNQTYEVWLPKVWLPKVGNLIFSNPTPNPKPLAFLIALSLYSLSGV